MTTQEASVAIAGMALIGGICWATHSAEPLWALLLIIWML